MRLILEILAIYSIYLFGTSILIWRFARKDRGPSVVVAAAVPLLFVISLIELVFSTIFRKSPKVGPCPVGLSEAEYIVEKNRQKMFGGAPQEPRFASDWARLYAQTVELEAEKVQAFARRVLTV